MADIFDQAIESGLASVGKTATAAPVRASEVPSSGPSSAPTNTAPPQLDTMPSPKGQEGAKDDSALPPVIPPPDDAKVSLDEFGDAGRKIMSKEQRDNPKVTPQQQQQKVPDVKPPEQAKVTEPPKDVVVSREAVLAELDVPKEEYELYKRMPNQTFDKVRDILKTNKELSTKLTEASKNAPPTIPQSYYEHEEGYTLLPEVKQAQQIARQANFEAKHWEQQYINIKNGEDWFDLDIDSKTGQYVTTKKQASPQSELAVLQYLQQAKSVYGEKANYVNNVQQHWKTQSAQLRNSFKQAEDQYFPQYAKDADKNPQISSMTKLMAERGQANNPLVGIFARLYAHAMEQDAMIKSLKSSQTTATSRVNSQPPSSAFNGAGTLGVISGDDKVSMDEFNAVLNRR